MMDELLPLTKKQRIEARSEIARFIPTSTGREYSDKEIDCFLDIFVEYRKDNPKIDVNGFVLLLTKDLWDMHGI